MFCIWLDQIVILCYELQPITVECSPTQLVCLSRASKEKLPQFDQRRYKIIFQHEYVRPRIAQEVKIHLESLKWNDLSHSPYSSYIFSLNGYLFQFAQSDLTKFVLLDIRSHICCSKTSCFRSFKKISTFTLNFCKFLLFAKFGKEESMKENIIHQWHSDMIVFVRKLSYVLDRVFFIFIASNEKAFEEPFNIEQFYRVHENLYYLVKLTRII